MIFLFLIFHIVLFIDIYFSQVVNTTTAMLNLVSIKGRAQMQCLLQTPITFNLLEI